MEEIYIKARPGFVIGDFKISKLDELNYIIEHKVGEPKIRRVVDKKNNKVRCYDDGGYKRYGESYFPTVADAASYLLTKVVPLDLLEDGNDRQLADVIDTINNAKEQLLRELKDVSIDKS